MSKRRKLVLVPGFLGSSLHDRFGRQIFPLDRPPWAYPFNGVPSRPMVDINDLAIGGHAGGPVKDDGYDKFHDVYGSFLGRIWKGIDEVVPLGWDWRRPFRYAAADVDGAGDPKAGVGGASGGSSAGFVAEALAAICDDAASVDVVTHSAGGPVVANALHARPALLAKIRRVIFVAPPFHGTHEALHYADWQGDEIGEMLGPLVGVLATGALALYKVAPERFLRNWPGLEDLIVAAQGAGTHQFPSDVFGRAVQGTGDAGFWQAALWRADKYAPDQQRLNRALAQHRHTAAALDALVKAANGPEVVVFNASFGQTQNVARRDPDGWRVERAPSPAGQTGDGTVLPASSYVPGLSIDAWYGADGRVLVGLDTTIDKMRTHSYLMCMPLVQDFVQAILSGASPPMGILRGQALVTAFFGPAPLPPGVVGDASGGMPPEPDLSGVEAPVWARELSLALGSISARLDVLARALAPSIAAKPRMQKSQHKKKATKKARKVLKRSR